MEKIDELELETFSKLSPSINRCICETATALLENAWKEHDNRKREIVETCSALLRGGITNAWEATSKLLHDMMQEEQNRFAVEADTLRATAR